MEILLSPIKYYHYVLLLANIVITFMSAWHALLYKRDPKASLGWVAVILMFPVAGYFLYFLLGVNRIRTRARKLAGKLPFTGFIGFEPAEKYIALPESPLPVPSEYSEIVSIVNSVTGIPLTSGNSIDILHNGEAAYPAMLDAIDSAEKSVFLSTYIFKTDETGGKGDARWYRRILFIPQGRRLIEKKRNRGRKVYSSFACPSFCSYQP